MIVFTILSFLLDMSIDPFTKPDYHGKVSSKTEIADRFRRMDDLFTVHLSNTLYKSAL